MKPLLPVPVRLLLGCWLLLSALGAGAQTRQGYLHESFEGRAFPPTGWRSESVLGNLQWGREADLTAVEDTASALIFPQFGGDGDDWLVLPRFRVAAGDSLKFWLLPLFTPGTPDSLTIKLSTTDSARGSFTRTLARFDATSYPVGWFEQVRLDLSAYAGQRVYLAFRYTNHDGAGMYIDDVELGRLPAADVRVHHLTLPRTPLAGQPVVPRVTVQNMGSAAQTLSVTLTAAPGGYSHTQTITLGPRRQERELSFPAWAPPAGAYTLTATAALPGDAYPADNARSYRRQVYNVAALPGWRRRPDLPETRSGHGLAAYRSAAGDTTYLLSLGGVDSGAVPDGKVWRYSHRTGAWAPRAPMPQARCYFGAHTIRGRVYVAGGVDGVFMGTGSTRLDIYDPQRNTWSSGAPLPTASIAYGSAVVGDSLLYVVGGSDGTRDLSQVQVYNVRRNTWAAATPLPGPGVYSHGLGVVGRTLLLLGGETGQLNYRSAETWRGEINPVNPLQIAWTRVADYPAGPVRYMGAAGAEAGGRRRVYFTGGETRERLVGTSLLPETWAYDLDAQEWVLGPAKPQTVQTGQLVPLLTPDSLYLAQAGGLEPTTPSGPRHARRHEWLALARATGPLPVTLTAFAARLDGTQALLTWTTAEEQLNAGFELSVSTDGQRYRPLASLRPGHDGFSGSARHYRYLDANPAGDRLRYYHLQQRDLDGTLHSLGIRLVAFDHGASALVAAPNPFGGSTTARLLLPAPAQPAELLLTDALGRTCWQRNLGPVSGAVTVEHIGQGLKPGVYLLRCRVGGQELRTKLVKE
ncbi:choice-of-anchor J domain-containing protein [Hymenobacter sp. B81]|uniref:choice-of-anchor J domain-containing protein n=1 Tax=Hymenobacter sp. B81 TaxID=3344878 RepID=UPI0037DC61CF